MVKNRLLLIAFLSVITVVTFFNLPNTFYQQDEWQTLGHNLSWGVDVFPRNPFLLLFGESRPLSALMYFVFLGFFKLTLVPAAIFGIIFQIINATLVFSLTYKITKQRVIALLAAIFLITNGVAHQAVTWTSALGTLPATTGILAAILFYLKYFEERKRTYLILGVVCTALSVYFKGVGIFLFILLPSMFFIYTKQSLTIKSIVHVVRTNIFLLSFGFAMLVGRLGQFFLSSKDAAGFVNPGGSNTLQTIFFHTLLYSSTSFFQIFVPPLDLYAITPIITRMQYTFLIGSPVFDLVAQSSVADMATFFGSVVIVGFLVFMAHKSKDKIIKRNILFAFIFFFLSFLPYVVLDRPFSYFSGRYFYVSAIPAGILFGYLVYFLTRSNKYVKWATLLFVTLFLFHHATTVRKDIDYQVNLGNERKAVLAGIKSIYPNLENKSIFYVTSNRNYLGDITNPFQNGLGYILEISYYDSGKIPKEFLAEDFLWDLGSEGYKEKGTSGFGYFQDIDKMADTMERNKLSISTVHAFFLDAKTNETINITKQMRERLATMSAIPR